MVIMRPASLAIVLNSREEVLLVLRRDVPIWVLPGGGIEDNEDPSCTAIRETFEETGATLTNVHHVATYEPSTRMTSRTLVFTGTPCHFEIPYEAKKEMRACRFFPFDALPNDFFFFHKTILMEFRQEGHKPLRRILKEISWATMAKLFLRHPLHSLRFLVTKMLFQ